MTWVREAPAWTRDESVMAPLFGEGRPAGAWSAEGPQARAQAPEPVATR